MWLYANFHTKSSHLYKMPVFVQDTHKNRGLKVHKPIMRQDLKYLYQHAISKIMHINIYIASYEYSIYLDISTIYCFK